MLCRPKALIISDFPIMASAIAGVLEENYDVLVLGWESWAGDHTGRADFIVADVTAVKCDTALNLLQLASPNVRVAVCSLHRNEVDVYWVSPNDLALEGGLPSLLTLGSQALGCSA